MKKNTGYTEDPFYIGGNNYVYIGGYDGENEILGGIIDKLLDDSEFEEDVDDINNKQNVPVNNFSLVVDRKKYNPIEAIPREIISLMQDPPGQERQATVKKKNGNVKLVKYDKLLEYVRSYVKNNNMYFKENTQ